ncbi:uncharacterized protein [Diadema setosum]|uniref:uncharacterized protein isoform X1 n=1 Tax=Diadema setosum TaxID=31175 RepID=UPI003B3B34FA
MAYYDPTKCVMCMNPFEKTSRGYRRTRLSLMTTPGTAFQLCGRTVYLDNFICHTCRKIFNKKTIRKGWGHKKREKDFRILPSEYRPRPSKKASPTVRALPQAERSKTNPTVSSRLTHSSSKLPKPSTATGTTTRHGESTLLPGGGESTSRNGSVKNIRNDEAMETESKMDVGRDVAGDVTSTDQEDDMEETELEHNEEMAAQGDRRECPLKRALSYFAEYQYLKGIRALLKVSPKVKEAVIVVFGDIIRNEMKQQPRVHAFEQDVSLSALNSFSWEGALAEARQSMPAVVGCLWEMMPYRKKGVDESNLTRKAGQMLAIALHARNRRRYKFVQAAMGIELWRQRASQKVFGILNGLGISQSKTTMKTYANSIVQEYDKKLLTWKESQEKLQPEDQTRTCAVMEDLPTYGFYINSTLTGKEAKQQKGDQPKSFQTKCYAVQDRVKYMVSLKQVPASKLDPYAFLPSPDVFERQRERAEFVVEQILVTHFSKLISLKNKLPSRIRHSQTKRMDEKSQCISLGIIDADPETTHGMMTVMEHLQKYIPVVQDKPTPCLLSSGVAQTGECILHAQRACSHAEHWKDRLEALYACPEESHKEVLHMQDSSDRFYSASSIADRGTVAHLRNEFNHKAFMRSVAYNSKQVWDFYKFVTEAHILLYAMKLCGMTSMTDEPAGFLRERAGKERRKWLRNLAQRVVDFCWAPPDRGDVQIAASTFEETVRDIPDEALRYCICRSTDKTDEMVVCCSKTCKHARFHLSCVGLEKAPDFGSDWYCSKACEESDSYIYCFCHKNVEDEMVQCHLAEHCKKHEWYHKSCLNMHSYDPVPDEWYCSEDCEFGAEKDDDVLNHTKALMYEGLCHLVRRLAVAEGDGPAMIDDWKADMVTFYTRKHPNYLINGHYFLACVGGFADPEVQSSYVWNRVANPKGEPGGNVGLECVDEFVNEDFAEMMRFSEGCPQMNGPYRLDYSSSDAGPDDDEENTGVERKDEYEENIERFTKEFQPDALFDYIPGRQHSALGTFEVNLPMEKPKKFGRKLQALSEILDVWKNINVTYSDVSAVSDNDAV